MLINHFNYFRKGIKMESNLYLSRVVTTVVLTLRHCDENFTSGKHLDYKLGDEVVRIYTNDWEDYLSAQYKGVDVSVYGDGTNRVSFGHEVNAIDFNLIGWAEGLLDHVICSTPTSANAELVE
jgi:hypothetical protein